MTVCGVKHPQKHFIDQNLKCVENESGVNSMTAL